MNKIKNLVLKASAGTGKTYRLSLEYIVALCKKGEIEPIDYKNILVMTFTRKATAEIKEGILNKLSEFMEIYEISKNFELSVIEAISDNKLIDNKKRNNYLNLIESIKNIEPNLVIDNNFLENLSKVNKEIIKNKEKLKIYTIDAFFNIIFKNIVTNLMKIKSYTMLDEEDNFSYYKKVLENIFNNDRLFNDFKNFFTENSEKNIDNYISIIQRLISSRWKYILSLNDNPKPTKKEKFSITKSSIEILREIFSYIENDCKKDLDDVLKTDYKKYIGKTEKTQKEFLFKDFKLLFKDGTAGLIYNGNKLKKASDAEHKEYINARHEELREILSKEIFNEVLIPYEEKIFELSSEIYNLYDNFKIRDKKFTFSDIAIYTYMAIFNKNNALRNENGLTDIFFETLDMNIEAIFIDEFQDTSVLQWKILYEFTKKAKTVICVGDEKQSIYGWRDGEKRLFENLETILEAKKDSLDKSYRSDRNIVSYCNQFFKTIEKIEDWKFPISEVNSKNDGYVKAICIKDLQDKVEDEEQKKELNINTILLQELKKFEPYDNVAIIARTNAELSEIANLLEDEKIPYILNNEKNISEYSGIFECFELLKYLVYENELALFNFISSPLSNFGTDEIEILLKNKKELFSYINFSQDNDFINSLDKKIIRFLEKIVFLKKNYKNFTVQDLIFEIIKKFQFIDYFNKDNEVKNIYDFYLLTNYYSSILELLNDYKENKLSLSDTNSEKKGVELVTIHKSKGLEFKTTFVIKNSKKSKTDDIDFLFEMNDHYDETVFSLFCKKGYKSILETCFEERIENYDKKIKEEEINNFYVALTRPKNNLIVIYEDRLFEDKSLKEINLEDISFEKSLINDFFDCKIGELSFSEKNSNNEDTAKENLESDLFNSQSYFSSSIYENEEESEKIDINDSKFLLETEEKRMIGILVHYFFENLKYGTDEEVEFSKTLCYKKYLSYFGEEKLNKIFSKENIEMFLTKDKEIFSKKWDYIYSEYVLYDYEEKKEYRIDRLMIKDNGNGTGEIYIVDFKTGGKNESQLKTYKEVLKKNFEELQNYSIKTKFLEFDI
ncbi:ATP-dependent DNA helicase pcrA [Fusobacterium polymorphum]|uniref:DNA 3'-5' helicase n=1 Tax=Fusobacterium polymorphum ATCC 10953 TaxID=393480 RepID=A5TU71_FUSNP|nr:exodeoxyribonuclease V subunit beta [Fusobacterium polymorphum]EDK88446.1 exodeoxyribonuclease V beta subunit [Fusobacterium polymorphum ATCC 10953]UTI54011.1 exodeoxyribonuclease V subunit beta [Fusobacterium polymorphum]WRL68560.1 exodeoxyribonuclease V subunit beta [Fusobacterium polymorphum]CKG87918.1 ATP-dependent DNA helicase pcrA [Fusobacterium polymorphum]